ncbi:choice-of-anchor A family protein [Synoicihabitans lomoniglobus]|uniref:Choice-of-anchor A family protein n=1 Tax=Synoicihabitans lomoniglobus TaxID=2909285 RepID=A0AAF0I3E9_9BACT|nr:choice-of-anchor A family protein [Opitutaceae bacterium LMO-M01]WED66283.1 choice-of-anchor A family protein [Opitutaceae bacterium LMO-M01]
MRTCPHFSAVGLAFIAAFSLRAQTAVEQSISQLDGLLRNYNLISLGNATFSGSQDTHGGMAISGDLFIGSGTAIAQRPDLFQPGSDPSLYVGGQLTTNGTFHLDSGHASLPNLAGGWTYTPVDQRLSNGSGGVLSSANAYGQGDALAALDPRTNAVPENWDWTALSNGFTGISTTIATASATGSLALDSGSLTFSANGITEGVVVFDLDMNLFSGRIFDANGNGDFDFNTEKIDNIVINVPDDVVFAVNVRNGTNGSAIFGPSGSGVNFNAGTNMDQLLWNITPDADPLTVDSILLGGGASFFGTVLAPLVNVGNSGNVAPNGQIVAANYTQSSHAELHYVGFDSPISFSAVPEPSAWGLSAMALGAVVVWTRSRRVRSRS